MLVIAEDEDRPRYHLLAPGEQPSSDNEIDLPENFSPAWSTDGNVGFTQNGRWLVGTGRDGGEEVFVVVDTSSGERTDVLESDQFLSSRVVGDRVIVIEDRESSSDYLLVDPSSPEDLVDIGRGTGYVASRDGRFLAISDVDELTVIEVDSADEVLDVEGLYGSFAPDADHLAIVSEDAVAIHELPSGSLVVEADVDNGYNIGIEWNGGDALVVTDYEAGELTMLTTDGQTIPLDSYDSASFVAPDSRDLVLFEGRDALYFSAESGEVSDLDLDSDGYVAGVFDSEDGQNVELVFVDGSKVSRIAPDGLREIADARSGLSLEYSILVDGVTYLLFVGEGEAELHAVEGDAANETFSDDADYAYLSVADGRVFLEVYEDDGRAFAVTRDGVAELDRGDAFGSFYVVGDVVYFTTSSNGRDIMQVGLDGEDSERYARDYRIVAGFTD